MNSVRPWTTGIVLFDGVEELDFAGPWEVLSAARQEGDRVLTLAEGAGPVHCAKGLRVLPDVTLAEAPHLDVVLVPGGQGTRREVDNQAMLVWLTGVSRSATWVTSVCTGSFLLHAAGPAVGKRVATHFGAVEELRRRAPDLTVVEHVRWVVDGNLVTSAGVSAGIDMALWLVGQMYDVAHARQVQRAIQYDPAPPYQADF